MSKVDEARKALEFEICLVGAVSGRPDALRESINVLITAAREEERAKAREEERAKAREEIAREMTEYAASLFHEGAETTREIDSLAEDVRSGFFA